MGKGQRLAQTHGHLWPSDPCNPDIAGAGDEIRNGHLQFGTKRLNPAKDRVHCALKITRHIGRAHIYQAVIFTAAIGDAAMRAATINGQNIRVRVIFHNVCDSIGFATQESLFLLLSQFGRLC